MTTAPLIVEYSKPTQPKAGQKRAVFTDWFDFADWLKQMNLMKIPVTVHDREYGIQETRSDG